MGDGSGRLARAQRIAGVVVLCLGAAAVWVVRLGEESTARVETVVGTIERSSTQVDDPVGVARVRAALLNSGMRERAIESQRSGVPYMTNPQRLLVGKTAAQSTREVVDDIGNVWSAYVLVSTFEPDGPRRTNALVQRIVRNVKVKRLVQEGRAEPRRIGPLVAEKLLMVAAQYKQVVDVDARYLKGEWRRDPGGWRGELDYQLVKQREEVQLGGTEDSPRERLTEITYAMVNCLYVLTNIEYAGSVDTVQEVLRMGKPRLCSDTAFLLFVTDAAVRRLERDHDLGPKAMKAAQRHRELLGGREVGGHFVEAAAWNAAWDRFDPLLRMAGAEPGAVPGIELEIPRQDIDGLFTEEQQESIFRNFLVIARGRR